MDLFYHHVGVEGAAADFPKTVFTDIPVSLVVDSISRDLPQRDSIVSSLIDEFPEERINCWGAPEGAERVIRRLSVGDAMLLVRTLSDPEGVPALGIVRVYQNILLPSLSKVLWGSERFPYIFFFKTEELSLDWQSFAAHVGYAPNYNPRGQVSRVASDRLEHFGSPGRYIKYLRENYSKSSLSSYLPSDTSIKSALSEQQSDYVVSEISSEIEALLRMVDSEPVLTDEGDLVSTVRKAPPRAAAFSLQVKRLYGEKCAVCGNSLKTPDGSLEVQSAHIYPKSCFGSDDLRNGICLCGMHHWAFDCGWFAITDSLEIVLRVGLPKLAEYEFIRGYEGRKIARPASDKLAPAPLYLEAHRRLHGFE